MLSGRSQRSVLLELLADLPWLESTRPLDATAEEARATFALVLAAATALPVSPSNAIAVDPSTCPNCDQVTMSERSPYCSDTCREQAAFVRQVRAGLIDGAIKDPERQLALGQKLWAMLGGGYPHRRTLVPEKTVEKVIARNQGHCEQCGALATTVDHSGTG